MFHGREFCAPVMSSFFRPHQSFDNITLDDIRPYFLPPRYLINGEFDLDTRLMLTVSLDSNPSEPSYLSYHVESDPFEPSCPSVVRLTSDSSSSSAASCQCHPWFVVVGSFVPTLYPMDVGMLEEEDVAMLLLMVSIMVSSRPMGGVVIVVIGLSFYCMACLDFRDF